MRRFYEHMKVTHTTFSVNKAPLKRLNLLFCNVFLYSCKVNTAEYTDIFP